MRKFQFLNTYMLGAAIGATFFPLVVHLLAYAGFHLGFALEFGVAMVAVAMVGLLFWMIPNAAWRKPDAG